MDILVKRRSLWLPRETQQRRADAALAWDAFHEAVCENRPMSFLPIEPDVDVDTRIGDDV